MTGQQTALAISAGSPLSAIIPTSFDDVQRFATMAAAAGLFKHSDAKQTIAIASMAILHGMELGVPPIQALQNIAIISGRATIWGDMVPAILYKNGFKITEKIENKGDEDKAIAICSIERPDGGVITREFSVKDAKKAGLWDTRASVKRQDYNTKNWIDKPNDSPWYRFPYRMLQMRARGFAVRDGAPDVMRGLYIREEIEDQERYVDAKELAHINPVPKQEIVDVPSAPLLGDVIANNTLEVTFEEVPPSEVSEGEREFLAELDTSFCACRSEESLHEIWNENMQEISAFDASSRYEADKIYSKHMDRIYASQR